MIDAPAAAPLSPASAAPAAAPPAALASAEPPSSLHLRPVSRTPLHAHPRPRPRPRPRYSHKKIERGKEKKLLQQLHFAIFFSII